MKTLTMLAALLLLLPAVAIAQNPVVNPKTATWTAPTTNADSTPLTDLAGYNLKAGPCPAGPFVTKKTVAAAVPNPAPNTVVSVGTAAAPIVNDLATADGNYCAVVTAVDTGGLESGVSTAIPFGRNFVAPGTATGFGLQ